MMSTLRERWDAWSYSTERALAPHVEETWAEGLVLELRLQGVSGPAIGEALSEVESHCAESGESAHHAFGDAVEYARSLRLPVSEGMTLRSIAAAAAPTVVQVVGMQTTVWTFMAFSRSTDLEITSGQLLWVVLLLGAMAGIVRYWDKVLRFVVHHPVGAVFAFAAGTSLLAVVSVLTSAVVATLPATPALVTSSLVLLGGALWERSRTRSGVDDEITSPLDTEDTADGAEPSRRPTGILSSLTYLTIPTFTVLLLVVVWWTAR